MNMLRDIALWIGATCIGFGAGAILLAALRSLGGTPTETNFIAALFAWAVALWLFLTRQQRSQ